jgi:hypothetical protein
VAVALTNDDSDETANAQLMTEGPGSCRKSGLVDVLVSCGMVGGNAAVKLMVALNDTQEAARQTPSRVCRYRDVGDDDPDAI